MIKRVHIYRRPIGCSAGFTLIELMFVVFLLSVVLAVVMPKIPLGQWKGKADARKAASVIRMLNETVSFKKIQLSLKFDLTKGTMTWGGDGVRSGSMGGVAAVELPSTGIVKEGELTVLFGPQGLTEHMWVHLKDGIILSFNPISGRVKVK